MENNIKRKPGVELINVVLKTLKYVGRRPIYIYIYIERERE
jgi:hypothetical protein